MVEIDLDETDFAILRRLDEQGDVDVERLSDELGVSQSTIYYRLERYRDQGLLQGTVADLDARKLGLELTAITEIKSDYGPGYEELGEELAEMSGVTQVFFMLGEMSFVVVSKVRDHDHLQRLITRMIETDGVEDSSTHVVLQTIKDEPRLLVNYDDEDLRSLTD